MPKIRLILLISILVPAAPLSAQDDAYLDPTARELVARSRETRDRLGSEIISYEAVVMQRTGSAAAHAAAGPDADAGGIGDARALTRGGATLVQMLAGRDENMGQAAHVPGPELNALFDPDADRFDMGIDLITAELDGEDGDFRVAHPLAEGSEAFYRYRSGDTLSLRLPGGRTIRVVELGAIPRVASFRHLRASLWLEPESGALVRAIFRPARELDIMRDTGFVDADDADDMNLIPGMLRPIVIEIGLVTIQYSLWDQRHWLPYRTEHRGAHARRHVPGAVREGDVGAHRGSERREHGRAAHGGRSPGGVERWRRRSDARLDRERRAARARARPARLDAAAEQRSAAAAGLAGRAGVRIVGGDGGAGTAPVEQIPGVGIPGRPAFGLHHPLRGRGLMRFNRVEALSLGVRGVVEHALGRASATVRLGAADLHPNVELGALVPRRSFTVRTEAYHRLASVDPGMSAFEAPQPALGFGNSLGALLAGRDDGSYYRASGATLALEPRPEERQNWRTAFFVEHHDEVRRKVEWSLASGSTRIAGSGRTSSPTTGSSRGPLVLAPWWGMAGPQAGLELFAEGVTPEMEVDSTFARARLTGRTILPVIPEDPLGAEAAVGHSWGGLADRVRVVPRGCDQRARLRRRRDGRGLDGAGPPRAHARHRCGGDRVLR